MTMNIPTYVYRRSRAYYLSEIAHFRRWVGAGEEFRKAINIASSPSYGDAAPQMSDRQVQEKLAALRRQFWAPSNAKAREADTHHMIGRAHLTTTPGRVTLTWQWFTAGGEQRSKSFTAYDDGDRRELERLEFHERPSPRARGFKSWASRDWQPVDLW